MGCLSGKLRLSLVFFVVFTYVFSIVSVYSQIGPVVGEQDVLDMVDDSGVDYLDGTWEARDLIDDGQDNSGSNKDRLGDLPDKLDDFETVPDDVIDDAGDDESSTDDNVPDEDAGAGESGADDDNVPDEDDSDDSGDVPDENDGDDADDDNASSPERKTNVVAAVIKEVNLEVVPLSACGDGVREDDEECDDGNRDNDDSCMNDCILPTVRMPIHTCSGDGELYLYQGDPFKKIDTSFIVERNQVLIFARGEAALSVRVDGISESLNLVADFSKPFYVRVYSVETSPGSLVSVTGTSTWGARGVQGYLAQDSNNPVYDIDTLQVIYDDAQVNDMYLTADTYNYIFFDKYSLLNPGVSDNRKLSVSVSGLSGAILDETFTQPAPSSVEGVVIGSFDVAQGEEGIYTLSVDTEDSIYWPLVECKRDDAFCGDGIKDIGEECDDGNDDDNDGCRNDCTLSKMIEIPIHTCSGDGEFYLYHTDPYQDIDTSFVVNRDQLLIFNKGTLDSLSVKVDGVDAVLNLVADVTSPLRVKVYSVDTVPGALVEVIGDAALGASVIQGYLAQDSTDPVYDLDNLHVMYDESETNDIYLTASTYNYVFFDKYTMIGSGNIPDNRKLAVTIMGPTGTVIDETYTLPSPAPVEGVVLGRFYVPEGKEGVYTISVDTEDSIYWPPFVCPETEEGLVGSWHFSENKGDVAKDASGNGNDGELKPSGSLPVWTSGKVGTGLMFDGVNDYIDLGNPQSLQLTGAMSVETWVRIDSNTNSYIVSKFANSPNRGYDLSANVGAVSSNVEFRISSDCSDMLSSGVSEELTPGVWHHLVGVYNPSDAIQIFVDGVLASERTDDVPASQCDSLTYVTIGDRSDHVGVDSAFNGKIDEVRIYNRVLSAGEVKAHYDAVSPNPAGKSIIVRSDDIGAWWSVDSAIYVTDYLRDRGIHQSIGILPMTGGGTISLGDDSRLVDYLNSIKDDSSVEFGLHGFDHSSNEFLGLSVQDAESRMLDGKRVMGDALNIEPMTFIPPYFEYDENALNAAKNVGMTSFSAGWNAIDKGHGFKEYPAGLWNIPTTTDFYNWGQGKFFSADDIKMSCEYSMSRFGTCVLLLHHYTFTDANNNIDPEKVEILEDVMDWVKTKESEGVELKTIDEHKTMSIPAPKKKFIVFRNDDVSPFWSFSTVTSVTEIFRSKGVPHVMSIIPSPNNMDLGDDQVLVDYLVGIKDDESIEFALHGNSHAVNEFKDISLPVALASIASGIEVIEDVIGIRPVSFVPPYHVYNDNTLAALKQNNLEMISSGYDDIDRGVAFREVDGISHLPSTADFYNWGENRYNTVDEIKASCENSMDRFEGCVIVLHHHQFADSNGNLDAGKVQNLVDVIDWAKSLESGGSVEIVRFKDVDLG